MAESLKNQISKRLKVLKAQVSSLRGEGRRGSIVLIGTVGAIVVQMQPIVTPVHVEAGGESTSALGIILTPGAIDTMQLVIPGNPIRVGDKQSRHLIRSQPHFVGAKHGSGSPHRPSPMPQSKLDRKDQEVAGLIPFQLIEPVLDALG